MLYFLAYLRRFIKKKRKASKNKIFLRQLTFLDSTQGQNVMSSFIENFHMNFLRTSFLIVMNTRKEKFNTFIFLGRVEKCC